jgi:hypothetical protein
VTREVQSEGSNRPRFLRPLGQGFRPDVIWALAVLAGVALGALLFDFNGLLGAVVGVTAVVIGRAVHRYVKRHEDRPRA